MDLSSSENAKKGMNYKVFEYLEILALIDASIRDNETTTQDLIAQRIGKSERQVRIYFHMLRDMGAPLDYANNHKGWSYKSPWNFWDALQTKTYQRIKEKFLKDFDQHKDFGKIQRSEADEFADIDV